MYTNFLFRCAKKKIKFLYRKYGIFAHEYITEKKSAWLQIFPQNTSICIETIIPNKNNELLTKFSSLN